MNWRDYLPAWVPGAVPAPVDDTPDEAEQPTAVAEVAEVAVTSGAVSPLGPCATCVFYVAFPTAHRVDARHDGVCQRYPPVTTETFVAGVGVLMTHRQVPVSAACQCGEYRSA